MVILVGAPGSGKSTFCEHVMGSSLRPWTRICQVSFLISHTCLLICLNGFGLVSSSLILDVKLIISQFGVSGFC
jgi:KaiC/GvpD/RAD55 family RecA-like ATPase